jgi:spore coat polysaccharide biosynthesis protein SpsF (cytidylyltransferase family)
LVKVLGITQARIGSSRLPRKILQTIKGKTLLTYHLERVLKTKSVDKWIVATTTETESGLISDIADQLQVKSFKGDLNNVLSRFYEAALPYQPEYIVRVTSDCPLVDSRLIDQVVKYTIANKLEYCRTSDEFPDGVDVEVFTFKQLKQAYYSAELASEKEHVTPFIRKIVGENDLFGCTANYSHVRFTVDEASDLETVDTLIDALGVSQGWESYAKFILNNPARFKNQTINRNEGYLKSKQND